jgi:hypothetical protein
MSNLKLHRRGGPTTAVGKKRSSRNARRHGLFAAEFSFSAADEIEFTKLNTDLRELLKPHNALLDLILQDVVACAWRMRIALRCEQNELLKQFAIESEERPPEPSGVGESFPCSLKTGKSEQRIILLDILRDSMQKAGRLPPEFEEPVTHAFGPDLWKTLTEWAPVNPVNVWISRLTSCRVERTEMYGTEPSIANLSAEEKKQISDANDLKGSEMVCKLIDVYKLLLFSTLRSIEKGGMMPDERESRLDLFIRYSTTARRDFYRSLREYREATNLN